MGQGTLLFFVLAVVALSFAQPVAAFGAGNIPSFSYLEDKAYRHGDIEDIIVKLTQAAGGGLFSRGKKFSPLDVRRVYFGNWLRDYSQAVDIGALKKVPLQTIINIVMVLGFLAHGYVTGEFEVTKENLGAYLCTEHIDNPKGYGEGEDARKYDPRLRPPVDLVELQFDELTGMKNYIANEAGTWDTSARLIRQRLTECIEFGRVYRQSGNKTDLYQAFQMLGRSLHTLEDFTAHSNWCELTLISMGHHDVFPHVGHNVKVKAPNGHDVYPLVTGTFGGADFIHSLMGEATDHLSQTSVSDLTKTMTNARSVSEGQSTSANTLRKLFFDLPGADSGDLSRDMDGIQGMRVGKPGGMDPSQMSPQDVYATLWKILSFRDSVMKRIENLIDRIPGLAGLVENLSNSISVFIITTLEPFVKPLVGTATTALGQSSQAVIDSVDQYAVWNDWNASDPTHSYLSKDHFGLILNQPAGEVAQVVVEHVVNLVVKAWDDPKMPVDRVTEQALQVLHHPDFRRPNSQIQQMMYDKMRHWIDSTGNHKQEILRRLTPDSVKSGNNKRIGDTSTAAHVYNSLLPDGGLQQVLAQHQVHVPGAQALNAGQDLMGGKMPWQQGFGSGGQHAWRDINDDHPNDIPPSLVPYEEGHPAYQSNSSSFQGQHQSVYSSEPSFASSAPGAGNAYTPPNDPYPGPSDGYSGQQYHQSFSSQSYGPPGTEYGGPPPPQAYPDQGLYQVQPPNAPSYSTGPPSQTYSYQAPYPDQSPNQSGYTNGPPPGQWGPPPPGYGGPPPGQW